MSKVKVNIDLFNGVLNIEGDSEFVEKQISRFESEIKKQFINKHNISSALPSAPNLTAAKASISHQYSDQSNDTSYQEILETHDNKIRIITNIPGSSYKEKIICTSLLLSFGESLQGNNTTLIEDIRQECLQHGCMDDKNFLTHIKSYNTLFLISGSGKSATVKLTTPGMQKAKDLANRIICDDLGDFFSTLKSKAKARTKSKKTTQETEKNEKNGSSSKPRSRPGPGEILKSLVKDDFFKSPKSSEDIIAHCKNNLAFKYETQEISSSLTRAIRINLLTRSKDENGQYQYSST